MNYFQRIYRHSLLIILLSGSASMVSMAQKPAYRLFREDGKRARYEKMLEAASGADIVLFGEYHTNPISHWLQLELTRDLYKARGGSLILGAEMFEADNQLIMDEYLAGKITETQFEEEARLWNNYLTDYKPLVLIAKENGLRFVATNIPRRYANMVFKQGVASLEDLSTEAKSYIAPLPLEYDKSLDCYAQLMGGGDSPVANTPMTAATMPPSDSSAASGVTGTAMSMAGPMGGHASINLVDAQAVKDATMSYFIMKNWKPGKLLVHYNGAYHSDEFESIYWFLKQAARDLNIVTISTVSQDNVEKLEDENVGKASFIIAVPSDMTQTNR
jgi:Haem-binding uptake, Tiki superfamily, ChaN